MHQNIFSFFIVCAVICIILFKWLAGDARDDHEDSELDDEKSSIPVNDPFQNPAKMKDEQGFLM